MGKRIVLLGDPRKGGTKARLEEFADWLEDREQVDSVLVVRDRDANLEAVAADLVMVFGGDGSLLGAARRMGTNQVPTVGINVGRLGFLTAFRADQAREAARAALAGELVEEPRVMMRCDVIGPGGQAGESVLCLNDGVVSRGSTGAMITLVARRNGSEIGTYHGDGVIVATPVGSTAYSMAAGGPVLTPNLEALVLTPLASHTLSVRPLVVPIEGGLEIEVVDAGGKKGCTFSIDGQVSLTVPVGGRARLIPAPFRFRHLCRGEHGFFEILREKFLWAELPRPRG